MIEEKIENGTRRYQDLVDMKGNVLIGKDGEILVSVTTVKRQNKNKSTSHMRLALISLSLLKKDLTSTQYLEQLSEKNKILSKTKDAIIYSTSDLHAFPEKSTHKVMVVGDIILKISIEELPFLYNPNRSKELLDKISIR